MKKYGANWIVQGTEDLYGALSLCHFLQKFLLREYTAHRT